MAVDDHKMRLEVGYGLEGDIPDIKVRMLMDFYVTPHFKDKKYFEGVLALVSGLAIRENEDTPLALLLDERSISGCLSHRIGGSHDQCYLDCVWSGGTGGDDTSPADLLPHIDRRGACRFSCRLERQDLGACAQFVQVVGPGHHHLTPLCHVVGPVVRTA